MKLKYVLSVFMMMCMLLSVAPEAQAQFLDRLAKHAKEKIKREAENRTERRVDRGIDKGFDKTEEGIDGVGKKKKKKKRRRRQQEEEGAYEQHENESEQNGDSDYSEYARGSNNGGKEAQEAPQKAKKQHNLVWSKFDFVPGDEVIFEDGPDPMEENGEFPSRWDLVEGGAEVAEVDGKPVIYIRERDGWIVPYLKNSKEDYLPEIFTIEMDLYFSNGVVYYGIDLFDRKNQKNQGLEDAGNGQGCIQITANSVDMKVTNNKYLPSVNKHSNEQWLTDDEPHVWRHISIAYTKGKLKVYMDDTRLINVPHFEGEPTGLTVAGLGNGDQGEIRYIKNIRIAKGGVKYYDRVLQDGKIIANGIRFDVGKTTLKPESMGPINKIYQLMNKKPELKFSVEGHTDSDGDDQNNQSLSEGRAKVVMEKLAEMGISKDRLTSKGWGESKPLAGNDTPEGKANNRRVEFVLIK